MEYVVDPSQTPESPPPPPSEVLIDYPDWYRLCDSFGGAGRWVQEKLHAQIHHDSPREHPDLPRVLSMCCLAPAWQVFDQAIPELLRWIAWCLNH